MNWEMQQELIIDFELTFFGSLLTVSKTTVKWVKNEIIVLIILSSFEKVWYSS